MTKRLDAANGTVEYDKLMNSGAFQHDTKLVTVASGEGELAKGTALAVNGAGKMVILGSKKTAGWVEVTSKTPGALLVVASSAGTGEIAVADVTPVVDSTYTPAADDYVIYQADDYFEADCILAEDVDATSADVKAVAFSMGKFNKNHLIVKNAYTLSDAAIDQFRKNNITFGESIA